MALLCPERITIDDITDFGCMRLPAFLARMITADTDSENDAYEGISPYALSSYTFSQQVVLGK
eukprot:3031835-Rhodomonas_salina.1